MADQDSTADLTLQTAEYVLARLTSYFGNRPDYFSAFIDGAVRAEGWLPAEAYFALSTPVAKKNTNVTFVRGKAQGNAKFNPDLELYINGEAHQLAIVPALTSPDSTLSEQLDNGLAGTFQWLGALKARSMIYLLAFPAGLKDEEWTVALAKIEDKYQAKAVGQMEFVVPRPPRPMLRGSAAIFLHASRVPIEEAS